MVMRPYQVEAETAILDDWKDKDKTLLVLPTGCGKTIVFANIAKKRSRVGRVLILAHREELLDQAADKLFKNYGITSALEKADSTCIGSDEPIVVGSVQTMMAEKRLSRFAPDYFKTIIIDEAHHALADSYQRVLSHFEGAKVLGVTATPDRGDMRNLGAYFENLAYEYNLKQAVNQGYLCPIRAQTMPLQIDISQAKFSKGDYQFGDMGHALEPYLEDIADKMVEICKGKHTVVFLPLVSISQEFQDILNRKGLRAAEVNGNSKDRDELLKDFEAGKYDVLCNAMLLTEGWDCPIVDCIVILRPTAIRSLYAQMVGRGTRLYPGKDHLLLLDFLWMTGTHSLIHPADIICDKKSIADRVTEALEEGEEIDLFAAEEEAEEKERQDAIAARKRALEEKLKAATQQRKQKKLVDPLSFELSLADPDLINYEPTFGWELQDATEKQIATLAKFGVDAAGMTKGKASKYLDKMITRAKCGMSSAKQIACLEKFGFQNVQEWTFEEANKAISGLAKFGWKKWMLPIDPETWQPERLRA